jgi:predicted acylesterase/phospholipase RssA
LSRLALVLGGGVSLGTYVAGAVTEILRALEGNRRGGVQLYVVAGSSAGSLTAAMVGRALAINPTLAPWLEKVWVDIVDSEVLLHSDRADRTVFMDPEALGALSRSLVTAKPASDDRRSAAAGDPIRLGFSLSNLHGIPYSFRYGFLNAPERFYGGRVHRDWIEFELAGGVGPTDPVWEEVRQAAVASAAFPFALPPSAIDRSIEDYPGARFPDSEAEQVRMWYTDGGLFDNEPVRLAKQLVERFPDHRSAEWRYILIDPNLEEPGITPPGGRQPPTSPARMAGQLAKALLGEAAIRDWIETHKTNARLEVFEELVTRLPELAASLCDPEALDLGRSVGELAERVAEMKVAVSREPLVTSGDPALAYLDENLRRIEADRRFAPSLQRVEGRAARTRLAKLIFVLESAAGLRDKEVMPLYLVAPSRSDELSGDFMGNFGGFFHREWRANDFRAGRRDARRLLERHFGDVLDYRPDVDSVYRVEPLEASFETMPEPSRRQLERYVRSEADRVLDKLSPGLLANLFGWAWKPVARRWAARRILDGVRDMN